MLIMNFKYAVTDGLADRQTFSKSYFFNNLIEYFARVVFFIANSSGTFTKKKKSHVTSDRGVIFADWKKPHRLSERQTPLGITGEQFRAPFNNVSP